MISKKTPSDFSNESFDREETRPNDISWQFTPENICGEGASCIVYRVQLDGARVAVKRLKEKLLGNPNYVNGFKKEYAIGRNLKHNALPTYRVLRAEMNEVYVVMDYVDGVTVKDFIKTDEGKKYFSSSANVRRFFTELVDVVAYLHRSGVIHCDIKPGNIMLRHTDRGVMLLDLDKSYSDTLNATHGGTVNSSDPLPTDEIPTAQKDILAIDRLMDNIAECVPNFPTRRFRRFHSDCRNDKADIETLRSGLQIRSTAVLIPALMIGVVVLIIAIIFSGKKNGDTTTPIENLTPVKDTVVTVIESQPVTINQASGSTSSIEINFDDKMSSFSTEAELALQSLSAGTLSNAEISDLMMKLVEDYTTAYGKLVEDSKATNPRIPATDVELAVARASERSRASQLLQQFTRAAADTINARSTESY